MQLRALLDPGAVDLFIDGAIEIRVRRMNFRNIDRIHGLSSDFGRRRCGRAAEHGRRDRGAGGEVTLGHLDLYAVCAVAYRHGADALRGGVVRGGLEREGGAGLGEREPAAVAARCPADGRGDGDGLAGRVGLVIHPEGDACADRGILKRELDCVGGHAAGCVAGHGLELVSRCLGAGYDLERAGLCAGVGGAVEDVDKAAAVVPVHLPLDGIFIIEDGGERRGGAFDDRLVRGLRHDLGLPENRQRGRIAIHGLHLVFEHGAEDVVRGVFGDLDGEGVGLRVLEGRGLAEVDEVVAVVPVHLPLYARGVLGGHGKLHGRADDALLVLRLGRDADGGPRGQLDDVRFGFAREVRRHEAEGIGGRARGGLYGERVGRRVLIGRRFAKVHVAVSVVAVDLPLQAVRIGDGRGEHGIAAHQRVLIDGLGLDDGREDVGVDPNGIGNDLARQVAQHCAELVVRGAVAALDGQGLGGSALVGGGLGEVHEAVAAVHLPVDDLGVLGLHGEGGVRVLRAGLVRGLGRYDDLGHHGERYGIGFRLAGQVRQHRPELVLRGAFGALDGERRGSDVLVGGRVAQQVHEAFAAVHLPADRIGAFVLHGELRKAALADGLVGGLLRDDGLKDDDEPDSVGTDLPRFVGEHDPELVVHGARGAFDREGLALDVLVRGGFAQVDEAFVVAAVYLPLDRLGIILLDGEGCVAALAHGLSLGLLGDHGREDGDELRIGRFDLARRVAYDHAVFVRGEQLLTDDGERIGLHAAVAGGVVQVDVAFAAVDLPLVFVGTGRLHGEDGGRTDGRGLIGGLLDDDRQLNDRKLRSLGIHGACRVAYDDAVLVGEEQLLGDDGELVGGDAAVACGVVQVDEAFAVSAVDLPLIVLRVGRLDGEDHGRTGSAGLICGLLGNDRLFDDDQGDFVGNRFTRDVAEHDAVFIGFKQLLGGNFQRGRRYAFVAGGVAQIYEFVAVRTVDLPLIAVRAGRLDGEGHDGARRAGRVNGLLRDLRLLHDGEAYTLGDDLIGTVADDGAEVVLHGRGRGLDFERRGRGALVACGVGKVHEALVVLSVDLPLIGGGAACRDSEHGRSAEGRLLIGRLRCDGEGRRICGFVCGGGLGLQRFFCFELFIDGRLFACFRLRYKLENRDVQGELPVQARAFALQKLGLERFALLGAQGRYVL